MKEADYIEATNLAKIRLAYDAMASVLAGYGPLTEDKKMAITTRLSDLLDECFASIKTSEE